MSWSAVLLYEGEPVTGETPCDDFDAAAIFGPWLVGFLGGPVSISTAVFAARPQPEPEPSLFDQLEEAS